MNPPRLRDWVLLLALGAMWGSAFTFVKIAVVDVPPATVAAGRLVIGVIVLMVVIRMRGMSLPPLSRAWSDRPLSGLSARSVSPVDDACRRRELYAAAERHARRSRLLDRRASSDPYGTDSIVVRYPAVCRSWEGAPADPERHRGQRHRCRGGDPANGWRRPRSSRPRP